jgi:hypothetical protein
MPIHLTIDHEARLVHATLEGLVAVKDVEDFLDAVVAQDALPYRKLVDGRTATGTYNDDDVMALGARLSAYASIARRGALAIVAPVDSSMELSDRLINLGKSDRPAKVFRSIDDARQWLFAQPEV